MKWIFILNYVLILSSCISKKDECKKDFLFEISNVTISPALDTFNVNDTIDISLSMPLFLEDKNNGGEYDMESFNYFLKSSITDIGTNPSSCVKMDFNWTTTTGDLLITNLSNGCVSRVIRFENINNILTYSAKIIPKRAGVFLFSCKQIDDSVSRPENEIIDINCATNSLDFKFNLIPIGGDSNYHLLKNGAEDRYKEILENEYNSWGGFTFYVIQ